MDQPSDSKCLAHILAKDVVLTILASQQPSNNLLCLLEFRVNEIKGHHFEWSYYADLSQTCRWGQADVEETGVSRKLPYEEMSVQA